MKPAKIVAYLKPTCGWSNGVRAIFKKYDLAYEDRNILLNPADYEEMVARSGQRLSPCVEIEGNMLADVSGAEVEAWLIQRGYVTPSDEATEAPTDSACQDQGKPIGYKPVRSDI